MPNYIRVINRAYWPDEEEITRGYNIDNLGANTITQDLRTKDNTLSLWAVENTQDVVLAMVSNATKIDDICTLKIDDGIINDSGLEVKNEVGNSRIKDLNEFHYNIKNLTYKKLADVSKVIIEALKNEDNLETFTKKSIIKILKKAIDDKRLDPRTLSKNIQKELEKAV